MLLNFEKCNLMFNDAELVSHQFFADNKKLEYKDTLLSLNFVLASSEMLPSAVSSLLMKIIQQYEKAGESLNIIIDLICFRLIQNNVWSDEESASAALAWIFCAFYDDSKNSKITSNLLKKTFSQLRNSNTAFFIYCIGYAGYIGIKRFSKVLTTNSNNILVLTPAQETFIMPLLSDILQLILLDANTSYISERDKLLCFLLCFCWLKGSVAVACGEPSDGVQRQLVRVLLTSSPTLQRFTPDAAWQLLLPSLAPHLSQHCPVTMAEEEEDPAAMLTTEVAELVLDKSADPVEAMRLFVDWIISRPAVMNSMLDAAEACLGDAISPQRSEEQLDADLDIAVLLDREGDRTVGTAASVLQAGRLALQEEAGNSGVPLFEELSGAVSSVAAAPDTTDNTHIEVSDLESNEKSKKRSKQLVSEEPVSEELVSAEDVSEKTAVKRKKGSKK